jgi:hypothetical protein
MSRGSPFLAALALLSFGVLPANAEVSVHENVDLVRTLVVGSITDDPTPIGIWRQLRNTPSNRALNPDGDDRGDGRPDIAWRSGNAPVVVWSFNHGDDRDIVYSAWTGGAWLPIQFLSVGASDDLDPRIFVTPDDSFHVVWWSEGLVPTVYLQSWSSELDGWQSAVQVSDGLIPARRPTVAVHEGRTIVAFERSPSPVNGAATDLVVATRGQDGSFQYEIVASTPRTAPLDIVLHSEAGHLWMEWIEDTANFGRSELESTGWTPVVLESSNADSWIGIEETRRLIRNQVLEESADVATPGGH